MSTINEVVKNTSITLIGNLIFKLLSLVLVIYLAKYLQVEDFGKYNFILAYLAIFSIITDLGLNAILVREMARDIESIPKIIGNAYVIKLILAIFAIFLSLITISLLNYPADTTSYIYIASMMLMFQSIEDTNRTVFQAKLKMEYEIIYKIIFKVFSFACVVYLILNKGTLLQLIFALTLLESVKMLLSYYFLRRLVRIEFDIELGLWKRLLKESFPVALTSLFFFINQRIDVLMLSKIKSDFEVGLYSAAYRLSEPLELIPYALIVSLFPIMSYSFKNSKKALFRSNEMGLRCIIITMLPISAGTSLIADKIILLIYDESYIGSITALQILIWALLFTSINYQLTSLLTAIDLQKFTFVSMNISAFVNVLLNLILIPRFSYNGASIATVISALTSLIISYYLVYKNFDTLPINKTLFKPILACLSMSISVYYLNTFTSVNMFFIIIVASLIYGATLIGLKTFTENEMVYIRKIFKIHLTL